MLDVEEAAGSGSINDLVERVGFGVERVGIEGDVLGGEAMMVGVAAGFFADVFIGGATVFDEGRRGNDVGGGEGWVR